MLTVGVTNPRHIAKHKRLAKCDIFDFEILCALLSESPGIVFTPNVLSETSNLLRQISDPMRREISLTLARLISLHDEEAVASRVAAETPEYVRLGLTDAVLLELSATGFALLTDDLDLYLAAMRRGLTATNFSHVRDQRSDFQ